jgi:hypothetical protein
MPGSGHPGNRRPHHLENLVSQLDTKPTQWSADMLPFYTCRPWTLQKANLVRPDQRDRLARRAIGGNGAVW